MGRLARFRGGVILPGLFTEIDGLLASLIAASISTIGILTVASVGAAAERNSGYVSAFAVGLLGVGVLLHLAPEAVSHSLGAASWILVGFSAMVVIGIVVQLFVNRGAEGAALTFGYVSIIGLAVHSFLDGVIYAAVFQKAGLEGLITVGGLLLHEFPEGVIAFFLLAHAGLTRLKAIILAFAAAAMTTVAGAIIANAAIGLTSDVSMAALTGAAAGALIYVLIFHLGPHAARAPKRRGYLAAQLGVVVGVAAVILNSLGGAH